MSIKDFLLWQRRSTKADSQTTPPPSKQGLHADHTHGFSRRGFIHTAAGATALAFGPGLSLNALAHDDGDNHNRTLPAPKPIPGRVGPGDRVRAGAPVRFYSRVPRRARKPLRCRSPVGRSRVSTSSQARSPTSTAPPRWPSTSARRGGVTGTRTIWRLTCGSWRASTSPSTGPRGTAPSPSYESTCLSPVRARRFTTIPAASFCPDSSGRSSFPVRLSA